MPDLEALRKALSAIMRLTDAEQFFLWGWFATGARSYLYRAGLDDTIIGPAALIADDGPSPYEGPSAVPSANLLLAMREIRSLPIEFRGVLKDWFLLA